MIDAQPDHPRWKLPGIDILFLVVDADPEIRERFMQDPASIFIEFGLGCPADLVGKYNRPCPVMPPIPEDPAVASNLSDPYWDKWLEGAIPQLESFALGGYEDFALPARSSCSDEEWQRILDQAQTAISTQIKELRARERVPQKPPHMPSERTFQLLNVSLPETGVSGHRHLFNRYRIDPSPIGSIDGGLVARVHGWRNGLYSDTDLDLFLLERDRVRFDFDNGHGLHLASSRLPIIFPDAKFLLCVREFAPWATAFIAQVVQYASKAEEFPDALVKMWKTYVRMVMRSCPFSELSDLDRVAQALRPAIPELWAFWGRSTLETLQSIPRERLFVVRANEINQSADAIASFLGVPVSDLLVDHYPRDLNRMTGADSPWLDAKDVQEAAGDWPQLVQEALRSSPTIAVG